MDGVWRSEEKEVDRRWLELGGSFPLFKVSSLELTTCLRFPRAWAAGRDDAACAGTKVHVELPSAGQNEPLTWLHASTRLNMCRSAVI